MLKILPTMNTLSFQANTKAEKEALQNDGGETAQEKPDLGV